MVLHLPRGMQKQGQRSREPGIQLEVRAQGKGQVTVGGPSRGKRLGDAGADAAGRRLVTPSRPLDRRGQSGGELTTGREIRWSLGGLASRT